MVNAKHKQHLRATIYQLKIEFGQPVALWKVTEGRTDYNTGEIRRDFTNKNIRRGILFPSNVSRKNKTGPNYVSISKMFTSMGGPGWDESLTWFLFDGRDVGDFNFELNDYIIADGVRYNVSETVSLGNGTVWAIGTQTAEGETLLQGGSVSSDVGVSSDVQ